MVTNPEVAKSPRVALYDEVITSPIQMSPTVLFPRGPFTVNPGQTKRAGFNFTYPENLDAKTLPVYSGKVLIKDSNGKTLGIPYLGLAANLLEDIGMFGNPSGQSLITSTNNDIPFSLKNNFTVDLTLAMNDFPKLLTSLNHATRELRWDIFDVSWAEGDWQHPPIAGKSGYIGSATYYRARNGSYIDPSTFDNITTTSFPIINLRRDRQYVFFVPFFTRIHFW